MADKRAQVTIFIILGIIIIIAFLLVMMLTNRYSETDRQAVALAKSKLDASVVSYYVTGCIEQAFNKGMVLLSSQGGRIYSNQNGSMLNCDALNCTLAGSIANVSYGLTLSPNQYATPKYPCIDNSLTWPYCKFYFHPVYSQQISLFGQETLPAMESIQRQLEEYIEYDVDKCINFDTIGLDSGLPFSIQRESPEVEVEIGSQDVKVNLFLPITIDVGGNIVSEVKQYTYADSIRLKQIYNFVSDIIKTDNRLLSYNVATDFQKSRWFSSGMQFSISYNRKQNDDLITITDQNSRINDKPLEFKFARQNLPPVLNYVHTNFSTPIYDNIYLEGQQLQITAEGFDPNEDNLIYSFSGWKVDYDEVFDSATGRITRRANVANPLQVNGNKASVFLGASDAGPHNITVSVTDGQFTDYQVVRVLVDDIVRLQVVGSNPYADIPNNFASVEDPYKFEAVTTDHFNAGDNVYTWDDSAEARLYEGSEQIFWLPGAIQLYNDISIGNIAGKFNVKAQHTINAKVVAGIVNGVVNQDAKVLSVNVRECLPHRSTSPPYPFNNVDSGLDKYIDTTADPFLGDHSCCIGDPQGNSGEWHIAPAGTICYEQAEYGALQGNNDVYKRGSVWRCDGLRGNICAGQK
ncbi:hypothetical protein KY316_01160, partial [Candidatus Woesearchaeota archaeon]|nr:hypothetical protein [Candidatus Woesearchaeota archaeon]